MLHITIISIIPITKVYICSHIIKFKTRWKQLQQQLLNSPTVIYGKGKTIYLQNIKIKEIMIQNLITIHNKCTTPTS